MSITQDLRHLSEAYGINLAAKGWIEDGTNKDGSGNLIPRNYSHIAQDAALPITAANTTVPAALLAYWDPKAVEILTKKRSARDMFPEVKKGSFAQSTVHIRTMEVMGGTAPYSDFGQSGTAGTNYTWPYRDIYRYQTLISVGDLETEIAAEGKIQLVADKQRAAATVIDIDANKFYLLGVAGLQIFGVLNDPSLAAALTPIVVDSNKTAWADKTTVQRYNDILKLFGQLADNMGGHVDQNTPLVLAVSPSLNVLLGAATDFNVSVLDMLKKYFSSLKIVTVPELRATDSTETMALYPVETLGQATGDLLAPEKFRTYPVFRKESSIVQKVAAATAGGVIYRPLAFVRMTGM